MANPNPSPETRFKPGESGNPGGKTSEQRRLELENAQKAMRIRAALLATVEAAIDPATGHFHGPMTGEVLKLLKDSEDRGLGAPQQRVEGDLSHSGGITIRILDHDDE